MEVLVRLENGKLVVYRREGVFYARLAIAPNKYQHRVLFWGIFGALAMRAVFIFAGVAILFAALGFNLLGALPGGDMAASVDVPVKLEIGSQSFLIAVPTDFRFSGAGLKGRGNGASD